jgi:hypothetical protein
VLLELAQATALLQRLVLRSFQKQPARLREERIAPARSQRADFGATHLVDRLAQMLGDVEAVQDVERVSGLLGDDPGPRSR